MKAQTIDPRQTNLLHILASQGISYEGPNTECLVRGEDESLDYGVDGVPMVVKTWRWEERTIQEGVEEYTVYRWNGTDLLEEAVRALCWEAIATGQDLKTYLGALRRRFPEILQNDACPYLKTAR